MPSEYIDRLIKCGYSPATAYIVYRELLERSLRCPEYSLDDFMTELEAQPCG